MLPPELPNESPDGTNKTIYRKGALADYVNKLYPHMKAHPIFKEFVGIWYFLLDNFYNNNEYL